METQKEESKEKLSSLEKQMSQVTAELSKLKANDKNAELSEKLSTLGTDLDQKLNTAENKISEFVNTFEKFQSETTQIQDRSIKKLEDVESQVKSFKSTSEGSVQDVMEDAQNLKVCFMCPSNTGNSSFLKILAGIRGCPFFIIKQLNALKL